jgi:hypothetical protein
MAELSADGLKLANPTIPASVSATSTPGGGHRVCAMGDFQRDCSWLGSWCRGGVGEQAWQGRRAGSARTHRRPPRRHRCLPVEQRLASRLVRHRGDHGGRGAAQGRSTVWICGEDLTSPHLRAVRHNLCGVDRIGGTMVG